MQTLYQTFLLTRGLILSKLNMCTQQQWFRHNGSNNNKSAKVHRCSSDSLGDYDLIGSSVDVAGVNCSQVTGVSIGSCLIVLMLWSPLPRLLYNNHGLSTTTPWECVTWLVVLNEWMCFTAYQHDWPCCDINSKYKACYYLVVINIEYGWVVKMIMKMNLRLSPLMVDMI